MTGAAASEALQIVCGHCGSVVRVPIDRLQDASRCPKCRFALFEGKPVELTEANFDVHLTRNDLPVDATALTRWLTPLIG